MKKLMIIPAAGLATRMMPMSASMSKAMIPVVGKPILAHILSSVKEYVDEIVVVHGMHDDIPNYLTKKNYSNVHFTKQNENDFGPLGAINSGLSYFLDKFNDDYNTIIWLGDTLIKDKEEAGFIINNFNQPDTVQLCTAEVPDWSRWCMIKEDASELFDKPIEKIENTSALVGIYKFNYDITDVANVIEFLMLSGEQEISGLIESYDEAQRELIDVTQSWVDCGDLPSLHNANSILISDSAREFNKIRIENGIVHKFSTRYSEELNWYETINKPGMPTDILKITPQFYGRTGHNEYGIEVCGGNTLQDLVLYHNINRRDVWENILHTVLDSVNKMHFDFKKLLFPVDERKNAEMFYQNIVNRYNALLSDGIIDNIEHLILCDYVLNNYHMFKKIHLTTSKVIHGDLHFGNIFFDAATNKVKLIDPRGSWGTGLDDLTTNGHMLYDLAKLYQSVLCKYCHISSDDFPSDTENKVYDMLVDIIDKKLSESVTPETILLAKRYSISLIASAIPCHSDNPKRQHIMKNMALDLIKSGQ